MATMTSGTGTGTATGTGTGRGCGWGCGWGWGWGWGSRSPAGTASDLGSAGLWAISAIAVILATTLGVLGLAGALQARQRAEAAADLAALSAARAAVAPAGRGEACGAAHRVAAAMAATVDDCAVADDGSVWVSTSVEIPGAWWQALDMPPARARARAGGLAAP